MLKNKLLALAVASFTMISITAKAEDDKPAAKAEKSGATVAKPDSGEGRKTARQSQSESASKTATFGKISKTDEAYKSALDAHELEAALKQADKASGFKGTVSGVYEPKGNAMAILNFDPQYKTAMTAVVRNENFSKFPDLKTLVGKDVLVAGKLIDFQGRPEIILTNVDQIKLVESEEKKADKKD
ncbi:hypothetical protein [Pedosphaera parvula]|uniref:Nucleic acid binding OB-fold tRNA/helicase-type n=1 Tax=Pedosphaera parvula (strain Ellin514) TaxID=320771 RepID=B9XM60_PEDPL|nr:hypothetical protein [Pedosphaera parvula]EEF59053.1 hypothetical protein Cflav_PD2180 [Pedosphaera parvula Ellin514]